MPGDERDTRGLPWHGHRGSSVTEQTLAKILGSEVHRANRDGVWCFPGGNLMLFVPNDASAEDLRQAEDFIRCLSLVKDGADHGGS